jgi:hypothetical protein
MFELLEVRGAVWRRMHQIMVNIKTAGIFNRFFEIWKSTRNAKNFAEIRALATWGSRVYHSGIYHDASAMELYLALLIRHAEVSMRHAAPECLGNRRASF